MGHSGLFLFSTAVWAAAVSIQSVGGEKNLQTADFRFTSLPEAALLHASTSPSPCFLGGATKKFKVGFKVTVTLANEPSPPPEIKSCIQGRRDWAMGLDNVAPTLEKLKVGFRVGARLVDVPPPPLEK